MELIDKGVLIVLSGPSGVGKGTVRAKVFEESHHSLAYSVSMTTRKPRVGEVDGKDYFFVTHEVFKQRLAEGKFLEHAEFVGHFYGTPLDDVQKRLDAGKDVMLEIEVEGALQVKKVMPDACFIFVAPPSMDELHYRIINRGTEDPARVAGRMKKAEVEIGLAHEYDYIVINDTVENAKNRIMAIIDAQHSRSDRVLEGYRQKILNPN
ncbi:MAG: guanylate kinase [Defluviitaleaceae bacterium]|nr:guanylate kinase [Defluviitaleaceae bacterium]